ncbi:hypothetical protein LCGC14_0349540 [marine sediment metagenome]|uniref:Uncharacterized protein n=1 Tax=marine sediment metagenome TaxID=412755 RepID=A0A0F9TTZ1_9ZZZZ
MSDFEYYGTKWEVGRQECLSHEGHCYTSDIFRLGDEGCSFEEKNSEGISSGEDYKREGVRYCKHCGCRQIGYSPKPAIRWLTIKEPSQWRVTLD